MKKRVSLIIDNDLLVHIKAYTKRKNISVSELVESYFRNILRASNRKKNIISLVENLEKPLIDDKINLKELYYQEVKSN